MRRTEAYRIYPEFKELFKNFRTAKGFKFDGEATKAERALASAIDMARKENDQVLDRIWEVQNDLDAFYRDYRHHLLHAPKTNRNEALTKWIRVKDKFEAKKDSITQTLDDLFIKSNIRDRISALLEITHYYRFLVHKKMKEQKLL